MNFRSIARTPQVHEARLAHQRSGAAATDNPEAIRDEQIFMAGACSRCHTIRGTPARMGTV